MDQITTADRSFPNLVELAHTGYYTIMCRFHVLKLETLDSAIKAINLQRDNRALVSIEQYCSYFQDTWQHYEKCRIKDVSGIKTEIEKHQLVVEVGLLPVDEDR